MFYFCGNYEEIDAAQAGVLTSHIEIRRRQEETIENGNR